MRIDKRSIFDSGMGDNGKPWQIRLELPVFENERINGFYTQLEQKIREIAQKRGVTVLSYLTVTFEDDDEGSLFIDLLFCRGRELLDLKRICDNRRDNGDMIPSPKKRIKLWYRDQSSIRVCRVNFEYDQSVTVKRSDYKKYITESVLRTSFSSADDDVYSYEERDG